MPISGKTIASWAQGAKQPNGGVPLAPGQKVKAAQPEGELEMGAGEGDEMDDTQDLPLDQNAIWSGDADPEVDAEEAAQLMQFLQEAEPEIHAAVMMLANAIVGEDAEAEAAGVEQLQAAEQVLDPEYPPFTPEQREALPEALRAELAQAGDPTDGPAFEQAIAQAIADVRAPGPAEGAEEEEPGEEMGGEEMEPEMGAEGAGEVP